MEFFMPIKIFCILYLIVVFSFCLHKKDFKRNLKIQRAERYMVNEVRCKIECFTLITSGLPNKKALSDP